MMALREVDRRDVGEQLADLLDSVSRGEEVIITEAGKPIARLDPPLKQPKRRIAGLNEGAVISISDDFADPLPDEFWFGEPSALDEFDPHRSPAHQDPPCSTNP
jgi:antitoxin (DNA-binding transcriptional repressor) of toxin-antitoxin stability system